MPANSQVQEFCSSRRKNSGRALRKFISILAAKSAWIARLGWLVTTMRTDLAQRRSLDMYKMYSHVVSTQVHITMFRSYKQLPIPVTHQRALAVGMSPHSRIFFAFIFSITTFVVVLHSTAAYNSFHNSAIQTLEDVSTAAHFRPIGAVSPIAPPWKSILRLGATQPRIGTCTVAHGEHKQGYQRALKTHLSHGGYHKYPMYLLDRPILSGLWSKEGALLEVLLQEMSKPQSERVEWLFWFDADTVIMNKLIPLETFLPPEERNDVNLLYTKDWNGLNNGVFALRVSTWSLEFLSSILAYRTFRPEEDLPFTEQSAMEKVMHMDKYAKGVVQCPPQWFNSYPGDGDEGDVHFDHRPGQLLVVSEVLTVITTLGNATLLILCSTALCRGGRQS